jgi:hypothetical protein
VALFVIDPDGSGPQPEQIYVSLYTGYMQYEASAMIPLSGTGPQFNVGPGYAVPFDLDGPGPLWADIYYVIHAQLPNVWGSWVYRYGMRDPFATSYSPDPMDGYHHLAVFDDDGPGPGLPSLYLAGEYEITPGGPIGPHVSRIFPGPFFQPIDDGADGHIQRLITVQHDPLNSRQPSMYATGTFTHIGGVEAHNIARWNGSSWSAVGRGSFSGPASASLPLISTLAAFDDDGPGPKPAALYAGGSFTRAGYAPTTAIARFDGNFWLAPGNIVSNPVSALLQADLGDGPALYVGGLFPDVGGTPVANVARWTGSAWQPLGAGLDGEVLALGLWYDHGIYHLVAGGRFTHSGGTLLNHLAIWGGSSWSPFTSGGSVGVNGDVTSFAQGPEYGLYVGGRFTAAGGLPAGRIALWENGRWQFPGRFDGDVNALAIFNDRLYAAGSFTAVSNPDNSLSVTTFIARLDGPRWSPLSTGLNFYGNALAVYDGALYVGGAFDHAGPIAASRLARWDGVSWSAVGGGLSGGLSTAVLSLAAIDEGGRTALYAGGRFDHAGLTPASNLARWDGASWSALGAPGQGVYGASGEVRALASLDDDRSGPHPTTLYAGGDFLFTSRGPSWYLAPFTLCGPTTCYANCDHSTTPPILNVADFLCFQSQFASNNPAANCDASTTPPILNINDFLCFQSAFARGCP